MSSVVAIPWGDEPPLELRLPDGWPDPDVIQPMLDGAIADYRAALTTALDAPLGGIDPIEEQVGPRSTVAIVVDDPSRWTPVREALPIVLERLRARGVSQKDISISVGVGRHHAVDAEAMTRRVGDEVAASYSCFSPPVDDLSQYEDLGTTDDGIPVRVFRPVAQADLRILIGSVLPHLQAGFGGGYKLIFPGTSHRSTLGAIHRVGLGGDAGALLGSTAEANPMRRAIRGAASRLGPCVSLSHVLGPPGQVFQVASGHPDAVQDHLAAEVARRYRAPDAEPADVVIAGNAPWPGDPMQSFKVLLNHRSACRSGGALVGFFWTNPAEIDRSFPMPAMRAIAATGAPGGLVMRRGLAMADRLVAASGSAASFMVRWARELVVDRDVLVYAPPLRDRIGPRLGPIRLYSDPAELRNRLEILARSAGTPSPRVRIFPSGGLTYCPARSAADTKEGVHSQGKNRR
ncbi:lactate racemase domain-containing protein [Tautonia rosea]|uniref:lactate racemase domain-containing protein n=1 Tax=Tautonia rosea TaxID=2728037 RepID=UPI001474F4A5|nr:lactate racemase domain-containing protein [Tautonia rosea]